MELDSYPWSERYGWAQDRYRLSWQLMLDSDRKMGQTITPALMYVGTQAGKAEEAITFYTSVFRNAGVIDIRRLGERRADVSDETARRLRNHDRQIAEELFNETRCDVSTRMNKLGTDLSSVWRRAFRYRAEREATANALRIREGKPVETDSRCSDGAWTFDRTALRFSREIVTAAPDTPMPLVLRVKS
jgi:uncharacterized glyoxalase superfamily protein PhnB